MKSLIRVRSLFTGGLAALTLFGAQALLSAESVAQDREQIATLIRNLKSPDSDSQIEAAAELGLLGPYAAPALEPLLQQLSSENPGFASNASLHLAKSADGSPRSQIH